MAVEAQPEAANMFAASTTQKERIMNNLVRVLEIRKRTLKHNPISGHSWYEEGPITGYEVRGPVGVMSKHRSLARAEKAAAEWREFYERHPFDVSPIEGTKP